MSILFVAAVLPVVALCVFIYTKDKNKEPKGLLALIFFLGILSVIPILVCELTFEHFFPMNEEGGFLSIFFNVLFGVAFVEESFKWLITKFLGYNNKAFDEVFDIIVYAVFASLGFACFENVMYVFQNGLGNALLRAVLAIPGHTCFAISMGYFFSKAKVAQISGNKGIYNRNIVLSIIVPVILHTFYDALIFNVSAVNYAELFIQFIPFLIFDLSMVVVCFITVDKTAKVQQNLTVNLNNGIIARNEQGHLYYNYQTVPPTVAVTNPPIVPESNLGNIYNPVDASPVAMTPVSETNLVSPTTPVIMQTVETEPVPVMETVPETVPVASNAAFPDNPVDIPPVYYPEEGSVATAVMQGEELRYCPICVKPTRGANFCGRCGFRLK